MLIIRVFVLVMLAFVGIAAGADVTGKWHGPMSGVDRPLTLELKSEGSKVTGSMMMMGKPRELKGSLDGNKIAATIASEWEGNPVTLVLNGTVEGDTMKVTLGTEDGSWSTDATIKRVTESEKK